MAFTVIDASPTIGTSEYSLFGETTSGVPLTGTTDYLLDGWIDTTVITAGDVFELKLYEQVNGSTQRGKVIRRFVGGESLVMLPRLPLTEGYDLTLKKISGTDRAVPFSLRLATPTFATSIDSSPTVGTSEYSLIGETTSAVPLSNTTDYYASVWIDANAVTFADNFELKLYEKVNNGTQRSQVLHRFAGGETLYFIPFLPLSEAYDITLKKISGSDRAIPNSVRVIAA